MKIKAVLLLVCMLSVQFLGGCSFFASTDDAADLAFLKEAAATLTLPESADSDITFPSLAEKYSGITLSYKSDNTEVITSSGKVTPQDSDTFVKITAELKFRKSEYEKNFNICVSKPADEDVPPIDEQIELNVTAATLTATESSDSVSVLFSISGTLLFDESVSTRQITLKTSYLSGDSSIEKIYDNYVIVSTRGGFSFYIPLEEYVSPAEKTVTLTLILKESGYDEKEVSVSSSNVTAAAEYGINKDAKDINYFLLSTDNSVIAIKTQSKAKPTDITISSKIRLLSDIARLGEELAAKNIKAVSADITLPSVVSDGYSSTVVWSSNNQTVLSNTGTVNRPWVGLSDVSLILTASVTQGAINTYKSFAAKVLAIPLQKAFSGVQIYQTVGANTFTQLSDKAFSGTGTSGTVIDIDSKTTYNEIEGAGGMLSHGTAYLLRNTSAEKRAQILNSLFSEDGAGFRMVRLPIGASDFPTYVGAEYDASGNRVTDGVLQNFSLCDTRGPIGNPLQNFSLDIDLQELIPIIKEMQEINPNLIFSAAPWTAPAWMKTSNDLCGGWLKGPYDAPPVDDCEPLYCDYLIKYIEEYEKLGIKISYLSLQNEPDHQDSGYPTMQMHQDTQKRLAKRLNQIMNAKGIDTKIIILDHNTDLGVYTTDIINDSKVNGYENRIGVGVHGYSPTMLDGNEYETFISAIRAANPNIEFYFTEMTAGNSGAAVGNLNWAMKNILMPSYNLGAKFTMYFNFVLDENGMPFIREDWVTQNFNCIGLIELNTGGAIKENPEFYALKHLSKFSGAVTVDGRLNNARRIKAVSYDAEDNNFTYTATMRADGLIALIAHNQNGSSKNITLRHNGKTMQASLAANSVTTFTWYA